MRRWIPLLTLLLALAAILLLATAVSACPMCKDSLAKAPTDSVHGGGNVGNGFFTGGGSVGGGFNNSIYMMLAGFFGAVGVVTFNLVRAIRK